MAAITAVQKNCENRKIPNPSLIGIAQVFSPQIRRKLEFSSIIPYNDSTVSLCATKAAVWVYSHAAFFLFHTSEADCMFYSDKPITCMPMVVADYIKRHIQLLDDKFLVLAADDIRRYLEDYAEHEPNSNLWQSLLGVLETEQRARATREARKIRPCPACGKPLEIMSIADSWHSPGGFDVIAHCRNCLSDYEWFCDKDGGVSDMKQYFFG